MKTEINYPQLEIPDGWVCIGYQTPKRGMGYITCNGPEFAITSCDFSECLTSVRLCFRKLEPVDAELESAKKLIGKWVRYKDRDIAFKLTDVVRDSYSKEILGVVLNSIDSEKYYFKDLTPFPLPVWRCCESDKPKSLGKYYLRRKNGTEKIVTSIAPSGTWAIGYENASDYEWLDEGER